MRYYLAYGSNLNLEQMQYRCPGATLLGTATIDDYELLFKGSKTGAYLTIEKRRGYAVPVAVWAVTPADEAALDRYEGFPAFYYKRAFRLPYRGIKTGKTRMINAFAYIMDERRKIAIPRNYYMETCLAGYDAFGFDRELLYMAYENSIKGVYGFE